MWCYFTLKCYPRCLSQKSQILEYFCILKWNFHEKKCVSTAFTAIEKVHVHTSSSRFGVRLETLGKTSHVFHKAHTRFSLQIRGLISLSASAATLLPTFSQHAGLDAIFAFGFFPRPPPCPLVAKILFTLLGCRTKTSRPIQAAHSSSLIQIMKEGQLAGKS